MTLFFEYWAEFFFFNSFTCNFPSNDTIFLLPQCWSLYGYDIPVLCIINWLVGFAGVLALLFMGAQCLEGDTTSRTATLNSIHHACVLCPSKLFLFLLSPCVHSNWVSMSVRGMCLPVCGVWLSRGLLRWIWRVKLWWWEWCVFLVISVYLTDIFLFDLTSHWNISN